MGNGGRYGCSCGSQEWSEWEYDAQGIELCRCCDNCREERLSHYRPEILSGYGQDDVDEAIEPDELPCLWDAPHCDLVRDLVEPIDEPVYNEPLPVYWE